MRRTGQVRFHDGKSTGSATSACCRRGREERAQLVERLRAGELRFVDARLKLILERHHQLDALERAQPEPFDRGAAIERAPAGKFREQRL